jgi:DegV family protein with EDD domain
MIRIVTDSSSDISANLAAELGVTVLPLRISCGRDMFRDGVDVEREEFLRRLTRSTAMPSVHPPPQEEFQQLYGQVLKTADQILAIHMSSRLTRTVQVARDAAKAFWGRSKITVVDSRMVSWGLNVLVSFASEAIRRGLSVNDTVRIIRGVIPHIYMVFFAESPEYWERYSQGGREAGLGEGLPGLRPLLILEDGEIAPMDRVRSRGRSLDRLLEFVGEFAQFERAAVLQGRLSDDARALYQTLSETYPASKLELQPYGPALASLVGPGALGVGVYEGS